MKFGTYEIRILPEIKRPEFALVCAMLLSLVALVIIILMSPISVTGEESANTVTEILKFRLDLLSIIITAFGAWVGAGAAYFFGKENLQTATTSILAAFDSPKNRLLKTKIRDLPPRQITKIFTIKDPVKNLYDYFDEEPGEWFSPIINDNKELLTVIHEEAVYRFKLDIKNEEEFKNKSVRDLLDYINLKEVKKKDITKVSEGFWSELQLDNSLATAEELMSLKETRITIIVDSKKYPTHYITTGDIRRFVLK